jgi:hypothetical protein
MGINWFTQHFLQQRFLSAAFIHYLIFFDFIKVCTELAKTGKKPTFFIQNFPEKFVITL